MLPFAQREHLRIEREPEPDPELIRYRRADPPARVAPEEVDQLGRGPLAQDDQVGLPLPVRRVEDQDRFAVGERLTGGGDLPGNGSGRSHAEHRSAQRKWA